jgi:hypothetical protein
MGAHDNASLSHAQERGAACPQMMITEPDPENHNPFCPFTASFWLQRQH